MSGFFNLSTAYGLREKLRRDLGKLKSEPMNVDAAFNFFVTAEHMLDWVYPKKVNRPKRTEARRASVLLQVCSQLANGAKHFEAEDSHHDSVSSTDVRRGFYPPSYFAPSYFAPSYFGVGGRLFVTLKGKAALELGHQIGAVELAEAVMVFWDNHDLIVAPE